MPLCFCCLSTEQKVNIVMSNFGPLRRLAEIEQQSDLPQFICGRILPVERSLRGPISNKECVYYEAVVERLEDKTDDNGLIGTPDPEDNLKVWVPLYFERKSADFVLVDPAAPSASLYVPGAVLPVKVLATEDTALQTNVNLLGKKAKVTVQQERLPDHIQVSQSTTHTPPLLLSSPLYPFPIPYLLSLTGVPQEGAGEYRGAFCRPACIHEDSHPLSLSRVVLREGRANRRAGHREDHQRLGQQPGGDDPRG